MRVLITGITGFVGSHMAEYALAKGAQVFGSNRWRSKTENIDHLRAKVTFLESDLRDLSSVRSLLEISNPDFVVHLAAQSFVGVSWHAPAETLTTNIISQVNLLEALRGLKMSPRVLAVGSSEEYGLVLRERAADHGGQPAPTALTVCREQGGAGHDGVPVLQELRSPDHPHPSLQPRGAAARRRLRHLELRPADRGDRGRPARAVLYVGDLTPRRDYSDVRDIVRGYWLLLEKGEPGEVYNLCSGTSWPIQQVLDFLLGQSKVKGITVKVDPARLRPSDVMILEGDPGKMFKATGWKVEIPFERTLTELLDYWRQRTRASSR